MILHMIHQLIFQWIVREKLMKKKKIKVIIVEPNKEPYIQTIENSLKSTQTVVGGLIEIVHLSDTTNIIVNEEGKLLNLKANRRINNDIIAGTFIIVGVDGSEYFNSLTDDDIKFYLKRFKRIENINQEELIKNIRFEIIC